MIVFDCPRCDRSITLRDATATTVVCTHCQRTVPVPEPEQSPTLAEFPVPQPEQLMERS